MPPTILYIAGWSRSGSTLLDQVLGEAEGWFSCGEMRNLPLNFSCGCGVRVAECELWRDILGETLSRHSLRDVEALGELRRRSVGTDARTLVAIAGQRRARPRATPSARRFAAVLADLYGAIGRATGARVLVDSSKTLAEPYLLTTLGDVDLRVAHLVRDPRATAYSWLRRRITLRARGPLRPIGPVQNSIGWLRRNLGIEAALRPILADRYLRVRYEDFAARPWAVTGSLRSLVGDAAAGPPFIGERSVRLGGNHMAAGNPARFSRGDVTISPDEEWRTRMDARSRALATVPAIPLMPRYGYPFAAAGRGAPSPG